MQNEIKLSVHQLVDFLLRSGDIDTRVFNRSSMKEGSEIHSHYQASQGSNYISEYPLKQSYTVDEITFILEGRADGIIKRKNGDYVIDEIKSTVMDLKQFRDENFLWHIGQAKCYALMFAQEQKLTYIDIKLTYIKQGKEKDKMIEQHRFSTSELYQFVCSLLEDYLNFYTVIRKNLMERTASIDELTFPFDTYRKGQRELSKYCYSIAKNGGRFYVEAPTGIGKTMSTLFPFIKALNEDEKGKIFYLTAKGSGKQAAYNAVEVLKEKGLKAHTILVTAKDKICLCKGKGCNPDECPFAKGYYNKVQEVLRRSIVNYSTFNENLILEIAKENEICPFEFELDLSLFCDIVICDYNYLFDPISYMKRYFDEDSSHYLALVDEAHNLIDRSIDMYSSSISYVKFLKAKKSLIHSKLRKLKGHISKLNKFFENLNCSLEFGQQINADLSDEELSLLNSFVNTCMDVNKNDNREMTKELLDFYLDANRFLRIYEFYSEKYIYYYEKSEDDLILKLFCLDTSTFLRSITSRLKGTIFFSATLSPIQYYIDSLGGIKESDPYLTIESPFPKNNFEVLVASNVSTKYKNRESSYSTIAEYIKTFVSVKVGNYFVYSPSYEYMNNLLKIIDLSGFDYFVQDKEMTDQEKIEFLNNFKSNPEKTTIGFLVLGGAFSEGIDLIDDRLIGAVVIGVGLPKINFESDRIADYYNEQGKPGREYAYVNPGINKIMQAVGRVIRSESDKGAALLIDERYMTRSYYPLLSGCWKHYKLVLSEEQISKKLVNFFYK